MFARPIGFLLALLAIHACWGTALAGEPAFDDAVTIDDIRQEAEQKEVRWIGVFRVRAGYPQTLSAGASVMRARIPQSWRCVTACPLRGLLLSVEPGLGGTQLGAGYATVVGEKRSNKRFLADVFLGFGVKGVLVRTWGDANLTPPNQTLAGVEFEFSVTRINISVGALRRIDDARDRDWIPAFAMGWGF